VAQRFTAAIISPSLVVGFSRWGVFFLAAQPPAVIYNPVGFNSYWLLQAFHSKRRALCAGGICFLFVP
jgi:hypothetical protein